MLLAVEEHGEGKQYLRVRIWPHIQFRLLDLVSVGFLILSITAILWGETIVAGVLGGIAALLGGLIAEKCGAAVATLRREVLGIVEPKEAAELKAADGPPKIWTRDHTEPDYAASRRRRHVLAGRSDRTGGVNEVYPPS
jgi:hypothetical protein